VPADAPAVGVPLLAEPVVAEHLGVKVVGLERRVVDVHLGALEEEEAVVVDQLVAAVEAEEDGDVDVFVVVDKLGRLVSTETNIQDWWGGTHLAGVEVEVGRVEFVALGKVGHAHAKVAELVHWCRPLGKTLELVDTSVLLDRLLGISGQVQVNPVKQQWNLSSHSCTGDGGTPGPPCRLVFGRG